MKRSLPEEYMTQAISLSHLGVNGIALPKDIFEKFLEDTRFFDLVILGGDVMILEDSKPKFTYESWSIPSREPTDSYSSYCTLSREVAKKYLATIKRADGVLISPVLTDQVTAGLMK